MKAIFVKKPFEISIDDVAPPKIEKSDDVLIQIITAGICGSDIGIFTGTNSLATYPRLIGHEYGGRVHGTGDEVTGLRVGDIVAVDPVRACGTCYPCSIKRHNVCEKLEVTGVHRDGGFAEYVVAPASCVHKVDTQSVQRELACLVEPYSIGEQVNCRAQTTESDTVLVMGCGPIGVCIMQVARSRGARVLMTDILERRLERAARMGAERTVNVNKENVAVLARDFSEGKGMTVVADSVCSEDSLRLALELASPAGRVVVLGLSNRPSSVVQATLTKKELDVLGSRLNNSRFPRVIKAFEEGALTPKLLVSHQIPYTEVKDAFNLVQNKPEEVCKILLSFDASID
jgi:L-gulonate 5-dehydrogenase